MLTQERLKHLLSYDQETGVFRHRESRGRVRAGDVAGSPYGGDGRGQPYWGIRLDGQKYYAHRLAWLYVHGEWPSQIDHKDRNKHNNAILNLRLCTSSQNIMNASKPNVLGMRGVQKRNQKFTVRISVNGERLYLGAFETLEEAYLVYLAAAKKHYGEFADRHMQTMRISDEATGIQIIA